MSLKAIGGGWVKSGAKGEFTSLSIELDGKKLSFLMFTNTKKTKDSQPDYIIYERADEPAQ